jgi:hypothetical protein
MASGTYFSIPGQNVPPPPFPGSFPPFRFFPVRKQMDRSYRNLRIRSRMFLQGFGWNPHFLFRLFSQSSGWKEYRKFLRPGGASRTWRDRISGNHRDSGAIAWAPQGTRRRSPCGKPNPLSDPASKIMIRREPMKEQPLHYVPPGAGCAPWAPPESPLSLATSIPGDAKSTEMTHSIGRRPKI